MEEKIGSNRQHKLILQNRGKGNITGICDVVSFDENAVVLDTDMGLLTIKGKELHVSRLGEHTRAFIKIQDGCNQFCSYCIIPYTRGRVRSRKPEEIMEEIKGLVDKGYREVVLTGIHLSSYGLDLDGITLLDG